MVVLSSNYTVLVNIWSSGDIAKKKKTLLVVEVKIAKENFVNEFVEKAIPKQKQMQDNGLPTAECWNLI